MSMIWLEVSKPLLLQQTYRLGQVQYPRCPCRVKHIAASVNPYTKCESIHAV